MNLHSVADLRFAWEHKVMPLLQEYFYGDGEKLLTVLGSDFVEQRTAPLGEGDSADSRTVCFLKPSQPDTAFVEALKQLAQR
jgi:hypothetical protein